MGQMAITGIHTSNFVGLKNKDLFVQKISFNSDLWINTCLPDLN